MTLNIRQKLAACLFGILSVFLIVGVIEVLDLQEEKEVLAGVEADVDRALGKVVPLNLLVKDIRLNVVQVQQWLTDISATRGLDGLDDGFKEAARHRAEFEKAVAEARKLATELKLVDVAAALDTAAAAMGPYYAQGETMAKAYIAGGPEQGNKAMGDFDKAAAAMADAVERLSRRIEASAQAANEKVAGEIGIIADDVDAIITNLIVATSAALLLAIALAAYLFRVIGDPIRRLLADLDTVAARDAQKELLLQESRRDEFGPVGRALHKLRDDLVEADRLTARQREMEDRMKRGVRIERWRRVVLGRAGGRRFNLVVRHHGGGGGPGRAPGRHRRGGGRAGGGQRADRGGGSGGTGQFDSGD